MIWCDPEGGQNLAWVPGKARSSGPLVGSKIRFSTYFLCPEICLSNGQAVVRRPSLRCDDKPSCSSLRHPAFCTKPTLLLPIPATPSTGRQCSGPDTFHPGWPSDTLFVSSSETSRGTVGRQNQERSKSLPLIPVRVKQRSSCAEFTECLYSEVLHNLISINFCIFNYSF